MGTYEESQHRQANFADILDGVFDYQTSRMIRRKVQKGKRNYRSHAEIQNRQYAQTFPDGCLSNSRNFIRNTICIRVDSACAIDFG